MATVPAPTSIVAGDTLDARRLNKMRDVWNFLLSPPRARIENNASLLTTVPSATWTLLNQLSVVSYDTDSMTGVVASAISIKTPGWYEVEVGISFTPLGTAPDTVGIRQWAFSVNGATASPPYYGIHTETASFAAGWTKVMRGGFTLVYLNVGDYLKINAYQNSGSSMTTRNDAYLSARWFSK